MIREVRGDILTADAEALVNPVNTEGVMGAGLALQFRQAYPEMHRCYKADCHRHVIRIGCMHIYPLGKNLDVLNPELRDVKPCFIINFPTKQYWRNASQLVWIDQGLADLALKIQLYELRSIAIPQLGCGLGGLQWPDVHDLMVKRLGDLNSVDVMLYVR